MSETFQKKYKKVIDKKEKQMYSYIKGGMKSLPQIYRRLSWIIKKSQMTC